MPKEYRGFLVFDNENDVIYSPFFNGQDHANNDKLTAEIRSFKCNVVHPGKILGAYNDLSRVDDDDQLFIWGHGNTKRNCLGGDDGRTATAKDIVKDFKAMNLPFNWPGTVILWSCFAGVAGGFAESLFIRLRSKGYTHLQLFAPKVATGGLSRLEFRENHTGKPDQYRGLLIYGSGTNRSAGGLDDGIAKKPTIAESMPGWNGARKFCSVSDLRQVKPGQRMVAELC